METKPYRLQAPEDIAKEYGGNKQRIAEAMQMGLVDPTAGVLAGMFIDRMRSAQVAEMAPQPTVAQQVMGGAPQAPVPPSSGGLGMTQPAQPSMAPDMAPPMEAPMPEEAPMGMAAGGLYEAPYMKSGGLSELPIPDTMFDEDRNGGYASGGIIAFAGGTPGAYGQFIEETALSVLPGLQITSAKRDPARNAQVGGVKGSYHLTGDARDFRPPPGMTQSELLTKLKSVFGDQYDVIPSKGSSVHVEPGPKAGARATIPQRKTDTAQGVTSSLGDIYDVISQRFAPSEEEQQATEALRARAKELASDEYQNKERKDSLWETLATIGFNMASSKSPRLLQAVGEAASAALPGARADKKERKQLKDRALNLMVELGAKDRKDAMDKFRMATDVLQTTIAQEQFGAKMALSERELALATRKLEAELKALANKPEDINDRVTRYMLEYAPGTPQHEAAKRVYEARRQASPQTGLTAQQVVARGREGAGGFAEGQTAKDTQGRTIVFQGGQWVYP